MGVYNLDITGFMARFDLVNATLAGVGSLTAALVLRTVSKSKLKPRWNLHLRGDEDWLRRHR